MNYDQFLHKPLFIDNFNWSTVNAAGTNIGGVQIPRDIFNTNSFLAIPWKSSCYYRLKGKLVIQVAGTVRHSGILLASAQPFVVPVTAPINSLLAAPHAFIYANQSNPAIVEIPFYNPSPLRQTQDNDRTCHLAIQRDASDSYSDVLIRIINPLSAPTGGSTTVVVTVHMILDELEFYTPAPVDIVYAQSKVITQAMDSVASILKQKSSDYIDNVRGALHQWTGLHNPNIDVPLNKHFMQTRANPNVIDAVTTYDTLHPYAMDESGTTSAAFFHTETDEMDMKYLLSIPQEISTRIPIPLNSAVGTQLFCRPITPFMGVRNSLTDTHTIKSIQSKLAFCTSHWSGDMELMLQVDMSNTQFLKLLVVLDYTRNINSTNLGVAGSPTSFSPYQGTLTHTLEFAGGGSIQCVNLPFMSAFRQLPLTTDWRANALSHGIVRIYVLQPPVVSDDVAVPELNVYYRCKENFQLYGFNHRRGFYGGTSPIPPALAASNENQDVMTVQSISMSESSMLDTTTSQECVTDKGPSKPSVVYGPGNLRPIVSVRDIIRRVYPVYIAELTPSTTAKVNYLNVPLQGLFRSRQIGTNFVGTESHTTPLSIVSDLFYGFRGSMKLKIMITGSNASAVHFYPPNISVTSEGANNVYTMTTPSTTNVTFIADEVGSCLPFPDYPRTVPNTTFQEMSDFNRRPSIVHATAGIGSLSDSVSIHDVHVPYMSHQDFVTNDGKLLSLNTPQSSSDSLGSLKISYTPVIVSPAGATVVLSKVHITIFVGLGDDARFGMLINTRELNPYFAVDGVTKIQLDPIQHANVVVGNTTVPSLITDSGAAPAYIG